MYWIASNERGRDLHEQDRNLIGGALRHFMLRGSFLLWGSSV